MSKTAVQDILHRIEQLSEEERSLLDQRLAELAEVEWKREEQRARALAKEKGVNQATIDQVIHDLRYSS